MRTKKLLPFVVPAFMTCSIAQAGPFGSRAARGVVVSKTFRPTPLSHSLGLDGIYRLLRGEDRRSGSKWSRGKFSWPTRWATNSTNTPLPGQARIAAAAQAKSAVEKARPKSPSLADVLEGKLEPRNRLASENFPGEMLPVTESF